MACDPNAWQCLGEWQPRVLKDQTCCLTQQPLLLPLSPDKQSLRSEPSVVIVSCKDGRQLLSIPRASKRHAGLYECSATNVLGSVTSSCTVAVAREPGQRPGPGDVGCGVWESSDGGCWGRARWALNWSIAAH